MSKETGGPAFPCDCIVEQDEKGRRHGFEISSAGMSIRDYFAGLAMQGDWAAQNQDMGWFDNAVSEEILYERAKVYYRMAEAMLLARGE